jgi:hypothetical protein
VLLVPVMQWCRAEEKIAAHDDDCSHDNNDEIDDSDHDNDCGVDIHGHVIVTVTTTDVIAEVAVAVRWPWRSLH